LWGLKGSGQILIFLCTLHKILCLQIETNDDTGGNIASDISNESHDVDNCGISSVRQVSNFVSGSFCDSVLLDPFSYHRDMDRDCAIRLPRKQFKRRRLSKYRS